MNESLCRSIILSVITCVMMSLSAQPNNPAGYQEDAYAFMDWFSCHDPIHWDETGHTPARIAKQLAKWDSELFMPTDSVQEIPGAIFGVGPLRAISGIDSLLGENDVVEMEAASKHAQAKLIRNLSCLNRIKKSKGKPIYWYYWPLFSKDRNKVLFRYGYWCGSTCGYGGTYILRRDGAAEWKVEECLGRWIS